MDSSWQATNRPPPTTTIAQGFGSSAVVAVRLRLPRGRGGIHIGRTSSSHTGLIQSCAGETPPRSSPSPSPELAESEISMVRERKQLGGGGLLEKKQDIAIVVERLFSNLNEATLEHEPGRCRYLGHSFSHPRVWICGISCRMCDLLDLHGM